jgi:hypothetical protein
VSVREHRFPVSGATPSVEVRIPAGSVEVAAEDDAAEFTVRIEPLDEAARAQLGRVEVDASGGRLRVAVPERRLSRTPAFAVRVTGPAGGAVRVAVASAEARLTGRHGRVVATSASGDVTVEDCAELQLRTASGDARVGAVSGEATVATASGDVSVDSAGGGLQARTASGDVEVGATGGDVTVGTASGDVTIGRVSGGTVRARTVSGDAAVGVVPGRRVWLDLSSVSGRLRSQLDDEPAAGDGPAQVTLALRSISGDLLVRRAALA